MGIDSKSILKLREISGAGIGDCQEALKSCMGDMDKALEFLRKKGAVKAAKKIAERSTNQGIIEAYIHAQGKVGVLVELRCETDFVAKNDEFKQLAHDIAMQIAAANPLYLSPDAIPQEVIDKEKEIYREQMANEKKPANIIDKIIGGKLEKYYQEVCLLKQTFIKDENLTLETLIQQKIAKIGEKIEVARFVRFSI